MEARTTPLAGLVVLVPRRIEDERGYFCEAYSKDGLASVGIEDAFVQDNISLSRSAGTLRGLHFQHEPFAQAKLLSVLRGGIRDVVVDLRRHSETFGQHFSIEMRDLDQLYIPVGFAHGFVTLEPETLIAYKVTNHYSAAHDAGICFNDPTLAIAWDPEPAVISDRDLALPRFDPEAIYFP